jgi:predicted transcriptional regulator YdeE
MKKDSIHLPELTFIGITARTSNANEMNPQLAKIPATLQKYFQGGLSCHIPNRKTTDVTYCAYTNYESDFTGPYTYFVGEAVTATHDMPEGLDALVIPAQKYIKFTTGPGPMPEVVIKAWQEIWQMTPADLGGQRTYHTDFEVYDERAIDPTNAVVDIFIGINDKS